MIVVHHLEQSRSTRVLWLLEELGLPYQLVQYARDPTTRLAPPELKAVHPLGKAPVIVDDAHAGVVAESGAIIEYLIETYGQGRLKPSLGTPDWAEYLHWLHFAEGSAMLPLLLKLYTRLLGEGGKPLDWRIESEIENHFSYIDQHFVRTQRPYLCAMGLSGADIQLSFVLEAGSARGGLERYPSASAYLARLQALPAYQRALERGGAVTPSR